MIKLSIIICTFNRSTELEQLLDDIALQYDRLPSDSQKEIELILVDNNSFDNTNEVVYKCIENTSISVKFFTEKKLGLTHCRNLAISKASGSLLGFLHDDLTVDEDWLREAHALADKAQEQDIAVYGARVVPLWQSDKPKWLNSKIPQEIFGTHSYGEDELRYPLETNYGLVDYPSGAHVFIRKDVFDNCGLFREDLGPSAAGGIGLADDYEFFQYLSTLQIPMVYIPQCMVFQPVKPNQMTLQFIRREYFNWGTAKYWISQTDRLKKSQVRKTKFCFYKSLLSNSLLWVLSFFGGDPQARHLLSFKISETLGQLEGLKLIEEQRKSQKFSFARYTKALQTI